MSRANDVFPCPIREFLLEKSTPNYLIFSYACELVCKDTSFAEPLRYFNIVYLPFRGAFRAGILLITLVIEQIIHKSLPYLRTRMLVNQIFRYVLHVVNSCVPQAA